MKTMNSHFLLKPILVFVGGVIFALIIIQIVTNPGSLLFLADKLNLNENIQKNKAEVLSSQKEATEGVEGLSVNGLIEKVLPVITGNPALAPMFKTSREIEEAVNAIRSLPDEQRNSFCSQICQ